MDKTIILLNQNLYLVLIRFYSIKMIMFPFIVCMYVFTGWFVSSYCFKIYRVYLFIFLIPYDNKRIYTIIVGNNELFLFNFRFINFKNLIMWIPSVSWCLLSGADWITLLISLSSLPSSHISGNKLNPFVAVQFVPWTLGFMFL